MNINKFKVLNKYQSDISNLRSHHWKYYTDIYIGCYYQCEYCLYMNKSKKAISRTFLDDLKEDLKLIDKKNIVYLGPTADVYQPIEKTKEITRETLKIFLENEIPVFLITRSDLVLRDIDILKKLAQKGLVEVSITLASAKNISILEPNTIQVERRLEVIKTLKENMIPTSIHLSPIIPYLDDADEFSILFDKLKSLDVDYVYACMLGMSDYYKESIIEKVGKFDKVKANLIRESYPENSNEDIYSAKDEVMCRIMKKLYDLALEKFLPFGCVHIPVFDTKERVGGIFKYKIPTIGDIVRFFTKRNVSIIEWDNMKDFFDSSDIIDDSYTSMIQKYWNDGVLFKNTYYHYDKLNKNYVRKEIIDFGIKNMVVK